MNQDTTQVLVSEDVSPQDIAILVLIVAYAGDPTSEELLPIANTLFQLMRHQPMQNDNQLIVIPTALDLCNQLADDVRKSTFETDESTIKRNIASVQSYLLGGLWNITSPELLDSNIVSMMELVQDAKTISVDDIDDGDIKIRFSPRSSIGNFIGKVVATLHLLHFDELFLLYEAFVSYREPTRELFLQLGYQIEENYSEEVQTVKGKTQEEDNELFSTLKSKLNDILDTDISFQTKNIGNKVILPISKYTIQALLDKQIKILETYGSETPQKLKDIMSVMTGNNSSTHSIQSASITNIPSYYYVKYLECLYESDYQGSFQALHQYFDYMVSNNSKYFYHFALISRASLHQYFDEDEKALDSIEEAISVARENKDNVTLTYILSWLFNFMRNKPHLWNHQKFYHNNNESHLLDFLVKKSKTLSLSLYSLSYHFEAFHIIDNGGSMNKYIESLLKGTYVSINDSIPTFMKSMEMSSVVWSRIGNSYLNDIYSDIAYDFAIKSNKLVDGVSLEIRRSYLLYLKGNVDEAYKMLDNLKPRTKKDMSLNKSLQIRRLIMLVNINLNKGRFKLAEKIISMLLDDEIQDIELRTELVYLNAKVQLSLNNNSKSLEIISKFFQSVNSTISQTKSNLYTIMRLNLLKCEIFNNTGNFTRAISLIIQQLQQAKTVGFITIVIEGIVLFCSILNNMGSFVDTFNILNDKMITILSSENKEFTSHALYELSRSCFNILSHQESSRINITDKELFNRILKYLNLSISGFKISINLVMLKKCFQLEEDLAKYQQSPELLTHSQASLDKLQKRSYEEISYGFL
ncbi:putative anaphase-promoting complex subunit 5 [[Candida] jaroonii]|uniref:Anaphase-promoting complex subunit 5 n=1 Tax=[Candida] jaroonii TaxID=467808 RepID=A0ACA9Y573_9ASCO|nr:putative anaphase-promoting complex subunit 5 [[Candida] jaroonii]